MKEMLVPVHEEVSEKLQAEIKLACISPTSMRGWASLQAQRRYQLAGKSEVALRRDPPSIRLLVQDVNYGEQAAVY